MKAITNKRPGFIHMIRVMVVTILMACSLALSAAEIPMRGTIQSLKQDSGLIRISGRDFSYQDSVTKVTLEGKEIGSQYLSVGMIVRYTVDERGAIKTIEILGPKRELTTISNS